MKIATTFGSSTLGPGTAAYEEGVALGRLLAEHGYTVKCGGYQGLMEAVSFGVREAKGHCIGVTLEAFETRRPANPHLGEKIVCGDLFERLKVLCEGSRLFIAQEGSLGTFNELMMVWTLKYADLSDAKIILLGRHWENLMESCPFFVSMPREHLLTAPSIASLGHYL